MEFEGNVYKKVRCFDPESEVCDFVEICIGDSCIEDFYNTSDDNHLIMLKEKMKCKIKEVDGYIDNLKYWEDIVYFLDSFKIKYVCIYCRWELVE